eukprot:3019690-Pleurochrysis_carterae.AAC.1
MQNDSIEDDASTPKRRNRCTPQHLSRHSEGCVVEWVRVESRRMGHKRWVVALWEPKCTVSDDPVGMQQCDDQAARSR